MCGENTRFVKHAIVSCSWLHPISVPTSRLTTSLFGRLDVASHGECGSTWSSAGSPVRGRCLRRAARELRRDCSCCCLHLTGSAKTRKQMLQMTDVLQQRCARAQYRTRMLFRPGSPMRLRAINKLRPGGDLNSSGEFRRTNGSGSATPNSRRSSGAKCPSGLVEQTRRKRRQHQGYVKNIIGLEKPA